MPRVNELNSTDSSVSSEEKSLHICCHTHAFIVSCSLGVHGNGTTFTSFAS